MDTNNSQTDGGNKQWVQFADDDDVTNRQQTINQTEIENDEISAKRGPLNQKQTSSFHAESENNSAAVVDAVIEIIPSGAISQNVNGHSAISANRTVDLESPHSKGTQDGLSRQDRVVERSSNPSNFADTRNNANGAVTFDSSVDRCETNAAGRSNSGFTNGDVIVSVLPVNTRWPWITPATFRPELVPEDLMVPGLTVTVEEYVHAMDLMTSDFRFNIYTICYRRLLASWIAIAFFILFVIMFSGAVGIHLFTLGISWLIVNAAAVFFCLYIKIKINKGVEECMARVNNLFIKHNLVIGLDDRGSISCHKVHLCFIYFDPKLCIQRLETLVQNEEQPTIPVNETTARSEHPRTRVIPPKQNGERLFLKYVQRWSKDFLRRRLDWTIGEGTENPCSPRHLTSALCPCQYIEEYTRHKPKPENQTSKFPWFTLPFKF